MKPITLHPSSLLVGVALAGLAFFTMAQTPQPINPSLGRPSSPSFIRAQDMVRITEGTPYVVPPNKWFVLTALGDKTLDGGCGIYYGGGGEIQFRVNGVKEVATSRSDLTGWGTGDFHMTNDATMKEVPRGLSLPAGSILEVFVTPSSPCGAFPSDGQAWGLLLDS